MTKPRFHIKRMVDSSFWPYLQAGQPIGSPETYRTLARAKRWIINLGKLVRQANSEEIVLDPDEQFGDGELGR